MGNINAEKNAPSRPAASASISREASRLSRLFGWIMIESIGVVIIIALLFLLEQALGIMGARPTRVAIAFPVAFVPFSLFCLFYARRGHLRSAIHLYIWVNLAAIALAVLTFGGIRSSAWILFIWTVAVAEALLGPVFALILAGAIIVLFLLLFLLQSTGVFTPLMTLGPEVRDFEYIAFTLLMMLSTTGFLNYLKGRADER